MNTYKVYRDGTLLCDAAIAKSICQVTGVPFGNIKRHMEPEKEYTSRKDGRRYYFEYSEETKREMSGEVPKKKISAKLSQEQIGDWKNMQQAAELIRSGRGKIVRIGKKKYTVKTK